MSIKTKEFAGIIGLSVQEVNSLAREGVLHPEGRDEWNIESVRVYCESLRAKVRSLNAITIRAEQRAADTPRDKDSTEAYRKQKTRMARYQADVMAGKLVSINTVEKFIVDMVLRANARLEGLPDALAANLRPMLAEGSTASDVKLLVRERVREAQNELSTYYEQESNLGDGHENAVDDEDWEAHSESVGTP